jgi:flagellar hook protein FlgE
MAAEVSTIQSLKAVDAWIDVINANISGGVRTAFKSSRLKFGGSNTDVNRAGTSTSLPLQFPEPGLTTANTVIDFTQGAITASTENSHLAIQGDGWFLVASPDVIDTNTASATFGATLASTTAKFYLTRDGEFRTDRNGFLVNSDGCFLVSGNFAWDVTATRIVIRYDTGATNGLGSNIRAVYNNLDNSNTAAGGRAMPLATYKQISDAGAPAAVDCLGNALAAWGTVFTLQGRANLAFSRMGSTVFDIGFQAAATLQASQFDANLRIDGGIITTVLSKSLEASNASMTQSVPELSLAQKLFSALTKVLQTKQTNIDGVLNVVR